MAGRPPTVNSNKPGEQGKCRAGFVASPPSLVREMAFSPAGAGSKRRRNDEMDESPSSPADTAKSRPFVPRWVGDARAQTALDGMADAEGFTLGAGAPLRGVPLTRDESAGSVTKVFGALEAHDFRSASPAACTQALLSSLLARGSVELLVARVQAGSAAPGAAIVVAVTASQRGRLPAASAFSFALLPSHPSRPVESSSVVLLAEPLSDAPYSQYMRSAAVAHPAAQGLSPSIEFDDVGIAAVAVSRACTHWGLTPAQISSIAPLHHATLAPLAAVTTGPAPAGTPPIVRPALELACDGVFTAVVGVGAVPGGRGGAGGLGVADWLARLAEFAMAADPLLEMLCRGSSGGGRGVRIAPPVTADQRAFADSLRAAQRVLRSIVTGVPSHRTLGDVRAAVSSSALCGLPVLHAATVGVAWNDLVRTLRLAAAALRGAPRGLAAAAAQKLSLGSAGLGLTTRISDLPVALATSADVLLAETAPAAWSQGAGSSGPAAQSVPAASLPPLRSRLAAALVILHRADNTLGLAAALSALVTPETEVAEAFGSRVLAASATSAQSGGHAALRHVPGLSGGVSSSEAAAAAAGTRAMLCDRLGHFGRALTRLAEAGPAAMEAFKPALDAIAAAFTTDAGARGGGGTGGGLRAPPGSPTSAAAREASVLAYASAASRCDDGVWAVQGPSHFGVGDGAVAASSESLIRLALVTAAAAARDFAATVAPLLEAARGAGVGSTYPPSPPSPFGGSMFGAAATAMSLPLSSSHSPPTGSHAPLVRASAAPVYAAANVLRVMAAAAAVPCTCNAGGAAGPALAGSAGGSAAMMSESQTSVDGGDAGEDEAAAGHGFGGPVGAFPDASASFAMPPASGRVGRCCDASAPLAAVCTEFVARWNSCAAAESVSL